MCTLIILKNVLTEAPLVVAANRDEAYARPWEGPTYHAAPPGVWSPTDSVAGGTWIGVNGAGLTVAVTNRRPVPAVASRRSRGRLCADVLAAASVSEACEGVLAALGDAPYNDFNMLIASLGEAYVLHHEAQQTRLIALPDGVHVLSNYHDLDDPAWKQTRQALLAAATGGWNTVHTALRLQLASHTPAPDGHLT